MDSSITYNVHVFMKKFSLFETTRNSKLQLNEVYFWNDTIKDWKHLLKQDKYKEVILEVLRGLVAKNKIIVYGFVIMPNHLHLLWEMLAKNGREMPYASFNKAIGHLIVEDLNQNRQNFLEQF